MKQESFADLMTEIRQRVEHLESRLPSRVDAMVSPDSKLPFKALLYRAALIWRMAELSRGAFENFEKDQLASALLLTRAAVEATAGLWYLHSKLEGAVKAGAAGEIDVYLMKLVMGSRADPAMPEALNVMKFVDRVEKDVEGFRHQYDILSEFAHPNWAGTALLYSKPDPPNLWTDFGPNIRGIDGPKTIGAGNLSVALMCFEQSYNRIADLMPALLVCVRDRRKRARPATHRRREGNEMPPQPVKPSIREVLLHEIKAQEAQTRSGGTLQQSSLLDAAARKLSGYDHEAILTQWSELFRTGLLAWGMNLSNPNPPFFHLTERGRQALENATRDPSNPAGYLRHLASMATLNDVAMSYLIEGLDCYVAGLFKAAAVMVGGAAESAIVDLRDTAVQKLAALGRPVPKPMEDWRIKTVSDALRSFLDGNKARFPQELRDPFEAYWSAFALQIRTVRNDAGHPTSVAPVTPETVHASLLIFPELARLANNLSRWITTDLT